jgi:hypothetical protein
MEGCDAVTSIASQSAIGSRFISDVNDGAWIKIDLHENRLVLEHYSLMHYSSSDGEILRSWTLEGSVNGAQWTSLSNHVNDCTLSRRSQRHTWAVSTLNDTACRLFRLRMTGPNSSHRLRLACGAIELFGKILVDFPVEPHLIEPVDYSKKVLSQKSTIVLVLGIHLSASSEQDEILSVRASLERDKLDCTNIPLTDLDFDWSRSNRVACGPYGDSYRGTMNGVEVLLKLIPFPPQCLPSIHAEVRNTIRILWSVCKM